MRRHVAMTVVALMTVLSAPLGAQAARVGRLPVLAPVQSPAGTCRADTNTGRRQSLGVVRSIAFTDSLSEPQRLIVLGLDANRTPRFLSAFSGPRESGRGENETVTVFFDDQGRVVRGTRSAFIQMNDENPVGLLAADTADALALIRSLFERCRG